MTIDDGPVAIERPTAIELKDINKAFGLVRANRNVSLSVPAGTIHGIIGENGAGKSTLMSVIYGFYEPDSGAILIDGTEVRIRSSRDAIDRGIGMVHQHFMLVETFTVLENVLLGAESGALLTRSKALARAEFERLEESYGLFVDPDAIAGRLPVGEQQRVEILKALYRGAEILILDEPTGVLTPQETDSLFQILRALRDRGVTVILITHKLREIMAVTDNVTVMRGGEVVAHRRTARTDKEELAELMVGRKVRLELDKEVASPGEPLLRVRDLSLRDALGVARVDAVSFEVRRGEIVGIAGVSGNGQSELLETLAGIRPPDAGAIELLDRTITPEHPLTPDALRTLGLAHVPEDRQRRGLVTQFAAFESALLGYHDDPAYNGPCLTDRPAIMAATDAMMRDFDVRPRDVSLKTANFSGGNQQKLVLARELGRDPAVLLVGQPTRGVDIGAIEFIHKTLVAMRDAGCAVLLVSVELEEVMALADRILVMFEGRIVGEVAAAEADERILGLMMANAHGQEPSPGQQQPTSQEQTPGPGP